MHTDIISKPKTIEQGDENIYIVGIILLVHVRLFVCLSAYCSLTDTHVPVYMIPEHLQVQVSADQQTTVGRKTLIGPRLLIYR